MIRRLILIPVLCAIWIVLFTWAAGVPWDAPWTAREHLAFSGRDFQVQLGEGTIELDNLVINAFDARGNGLQTARLTHVRAEKYPILRYRITDFPNVLELALVFRRDTRDDVQTISLPTPENGEITVDLSRFSEWRGEINELGFAEYATAQLVPPSTIASFHPFRIEWAQLQPPAWDSVLPRLRSDWFGYRPWSLQSINTIGPGNGTLGRSWMMPILALGALLSGLAACLLLRLPRARAAAVMCWIAGCTWISLDLRWLEDFFTKHRVIESIYAGKSWAQRYALQPDEETLVVAGDVARIAEQQGAKRVLVDSSSPFIFLRLIYFLLPLNAAPLEQTMREAPEMALPEDVLIAVYASDWKYDKATGLLGNGELVVFVKPVYEKGDLRVFRSEGVDQ
ncbi:hypothetical protein [Rudaea sp.]|uniref:hypothetical protein n=1 Tax=Rudaea sp. TaxID=2136325 RepID=UPI002ED0D8E7